MNAEQHEWYWRGYNDAKKREKREFVGLTDEDLRELGFTSRPRWWPALEAKLKDKNT